MGRGQYLVNLRTFYLLCYLLMYLLICSPLFIQEDPGESLSDCEKDKEEEELEEENPKTEEEESEDSFVVPDGYLSEDEVNLLFFKQVLLLKLLGFGLCTCHLACCFLKKSIVVLCRKMLIEKSSSGCFEKF